MNGNFFVLNVGVYAKKWVVFSQISTANAPITNLLKLQIKNQSIKWLIFLLSNFENKNIILNRYVY